MCVCVFYVVNTRNKNKKYPLPILSIFFRTAKFGEYFTNLES